MSDLADILWQQFGTEAGEHLDVVERELGDNPTHEGEERVSALFRAFHSIKGLAAAMGVTAMEAVAHSAENLLARVRDGSLALDDSRAVLLIDATDVLRAMSEAAGRARADVTPDETMQQRLEEAVGESGGARAARGGGDSGDEQRSSGIDGADERVVALGRRTAAAMEELVAALLPGASEEALRRLDDELVALDAAVGELGYQGLRRQIRRLSRAVHGGRPDIELMYDMALAIGVLEELTGEDAGSRVLLGHVAQSGAGELVRLGARAAESVRDAVPGGAQAAAVADLLQQAARRADLLSLGRSAMLLRLAADLLRRGELEDDARTTLIGVFDHVIDRAASNPPDDLDESTATRLGEMLRALIGGKGIEATMERAMALGVSRSLLEQLSDDARMRLERVIDDPGQLLVEIDADLDSETELAEGFAAWVSDNADQVTSRMVTTDAGSRTQLLLATPARAAAVRADLRTLDRSGERLRVAICDGESEPQVGEQGAAAAPSDETLRVPTRLIDGILERLGELMPVSAGLEDLVGRPVLSAEVREELLSREGGAAFEHVVDAVDARHEALRVLGDNLARALKGLRDAALELRIVPVDLLFNRYPRVVREMARLQDKDIALHLEPNGARIDKGMIERLADPLLHMIRNAIDHGIEASAEREAAGKPGRATLILRAEQRGEHVTIAIADDGRGLDTDRIRARALERGLVNADAAAELDDNAVHRLIFAAGFSTASEVTATSGRGVGMDVVATAATELGGSVRLDSRPGEGTTIALDLPLSVAIQSTLVLEQSGQLFVLPDRHVSAVARRPDADVVDLPEQAGMPVVPLAELLDLPPGRDEEVVVIASGTRRMALAVGRVLRRADVLVKESHPVIANVPGLVGATRLGDGQIVLILDPEGLFALAGAGEQAGPGEVGPGRDPN